MFSSFGAVTKIKEKNSLSRLLSVDVNKPLKCEEFQHGVSIAGDFMCATIEMQ